MGALTTRKYLQVILDSEAEYEAHIKDQQGKGSLLQVEGRLGSLPMPLFRACCKKLPSAVRSVLLGCKYVDGPQHHTVPPQHHTVDGVLQQPLIGIPGTSPANGGGYISMPRMPATA